jgi:predicted nucleic acid-binding protein
VIVVDASALIELLLRTPLGVRVEARLFDQPVALHAPHLIDVEVIQVLRRFEQRGELSAARSLAALRVFEALPIRRFPHEPLLARIWSLRENCTAYDAAYVALAEALGAVLLTSDARLGRTPGLRANVEVLV